MFGLFKPSKKAIIEGFEKKIFRAWGIHKPTDAHRLKLRLSFVCATAATLHRIGIPNSNKLIDQISRDVVELSKELSVSVGQLAGPSRPTETIDFSIDRLIKSVDVLGVGVDESTSLDGLTAMDGMYAAFGQDGAAWISDHANGPFGESAAIYIFMHDLTVGGRSNDLERLTIPGT